MLFRSGSGDLAAWTGMDGEAISLLSTRTGVVTEIPGEEGQMLQVLGFMQEDLIYGTADLALVGRDMAGQRTVPMHRVIIRGHNGSELREFDYASKGKYVTDVEIIENRIDLSCVTMRADGSFEETLPEPITYTSEPVQERLKRSEEHTSELQSQR